MPFRACWLMPLWALLLFVLAFPLGATETDAATQQRLGQWESTINKIEKRVDSGRTGTLEEQDLRDQLKSIADEASILRDQATRQARQQKVLLEALGPAPESETGSETTTLKQQRTDLREKAALYEGRAKQAGLIIARTDQVVGKIASLSRERFKTELFERSLTPLNSSTWTIAVPEAVDLFTRTLITPPQAWWDAITLDEELYETLWKNFAIALIIALVGWAMASALRKRYGRTHDISQPSHARRLLAGLVEGGGRALPPAIFIVLFGGLLFEQGHLDGTIAPLAQALVRNLTLFFFGYALINAGLMPKRAEWHLLPFGMVASRLLSRRLKLVLTVFLILDGLNRATSWAEPSAELNAVAALVFTLTLVTLLMTLLDARIWSPAENTQEPQPSEQQETLPTMVLRLRPILTLVFVVPPLLSVFSGYPGLAVYLLRSLIMTGLVLSGLGLLRSVGRESLMLSFDDHGTVGRFVRNLFAMKAEASQRAVFWLNVILDLVLIVVAAMTLLSVWGLGAEESAVTLGKLMRGIEIGSYTLSLFDIAVGLTLFLVIIFITRMIQKGLERHILPNMTRDKGIQAALKTGIGYVGTVIALLATVAALGLDLTNLALIAGALSVGLGFGLQNVVNNFVSGLILLAERPIKPGDWVIVGGHEGTVKKVNVRSTEVETFQRASVIIPNADLISTPVVNWTHKNILGRVEVAVGVAYGTDPAKIKKILLECASAHPNVIRYPEPYVLFTDFADSSLNFEVRAYLADVEKRLHTGSDLRFAIDKAFKDQGVEIPFPQRVVHMAAPKSDAPKAETPIAPAEPESPSTPDNT